LPQINSISNALFATFGINHIITGGVLAIILASIIIGGIKRIAKVTEMLVPTMALIYFVGAFSVIFYNYQNIIPSLISIVSDIFTGTAATGGFLGAGFAFAFNRGVNRGLFSNESGQGSAPIAHAAARTKEPVSEGMVAILEPFIDTIIICFLTGLVLLSSGAWSEKHQNQFQMADMEILNQKIDENQAEALKLVQKHVTSDQKIALFSGDLMVENGTIVNEISIIHSRSVAENIQVFSGKELFTGKIHVANGKLNLSKIKGGDKIYLTGKSLVHSATLTTVAFSKSFLGSWGKYIVAISLLLFAFSTAISWSYYGDRAMTYLWGTKSVIYYRIIYVIAFFFAAFTDTIIIWTLSGITIALMTIPNLYGIFMLRKDMKQTVNKYWEDFDKEHKENI